MANTGHRRPIAVLTSRARTVYAQLICDVRLAQYGAANSRRSAADRPAGTMGACNSTERPGLIGRAARPAAGRGFPGSLRRLRAEGPPICPACSPALDAGWTSRPAYRSGCPARSRRRCCSSTGAPRSAASCVTPCTRIKYGGEQRLGEPLGAAVARRWAAIGVGADVVVHVPVHADRARMRGYDQAELIARSAARTGPAPCRRSSNVGGRRSPSSTSIGATARPTWPARSGCARAAATSPAAGSSSSTTSRRRARRWPRAPRPAGRGAGRVGVTVPATLSVPAPAHGVAHAERRSGPRSAYTRACHDSSGPRRCPMRTIVKGKNVEVPDRVREYAERRLGRLERLLDDRSDAIVEFSQRDPPQRVRRPHRRGHPGHRRPGPAQPCGRHQLPGRHRHRHRQGRAPGGRPQVEAARPFPAGGGEGAPAQARRRDRGPRARAPDRQDEALRHRADVRGGRDRRDGRARPSVLRVRQRRDRAGRDPVRAARTATTASSSRPSAASTPRAAQVARRRRAEASIPSPASRRSPARVAARSTRPALHPRAPGSVVRRPSRMNDALGPGRGPRGSEAPRPWRASYDAADAARRSTTRCPPAARPAAWSRPSTGHTRSAPTRSRSSPTTRRPGAGAPSPRRARGLPRATASSTTSGPIAIHAAYLVNPAGPDPTSSSARSTCSPTSCAAPRAFGARFVNVHTGSHRGPRASTDAGIEQRRARPCRGRASAERRRRRRTPAMLVLENSAGSGCGSGTDVDELAGDRRRHRPRAACPPAGRLLPRHGPRLGRRHRPRRPGRDRRLPRRLRRPHRPATAWSWSTSTTRAPSGLAARPPRAPGRGPDRRGRARPPAAPPRPRPRGVHPRDAGHGRGLRRRQHRAGARARRRRAARPRCRPRRSTLRGSSRARSAPA